MVSREQVDKLINEKLEQLSDGRVLGDAKNRALNLKLRANQVSNPSQLNFSAKRGFGGFED